MNEAGSRLIGMWRAVWRRHGGKVRVAGLGYLAVAAVGKTLYSLPRLVSDIEPWSALDLRYRFNEVREWFAGNPVYGVVDGAVYPPASHVILWPFIGWLPLDGARMVWALTTLAAAVVVAWLLFRASEAGGPRDGERTPDGTRTLDRMLLAGLALASYPLHIGMGVGQLGMHVAAFAIAGAAILVWARASLRIDIVAGLLLASALVKPTVSLPIVMAAVIVAGRARPAVLVAGIYGAITLAAAALQPATLLTLVRDWLAIASVRVPIEDGVPNLHLLLLWLGLDGWMTPASLVLISVAGVWMWHVRHSDPWLLLGIAALIARFWAHSTLYDDVILLLPALALLRTASQRADVHGTVAGWLFAGVWAALLTPTWAFYGRSGTVLHALQGVQAALWLAVLTLLVMRVRDGVPSRESGADPASPGKSGSYC
ncbi:MAG: glycosyltransferase 87 family protein [Gemmatimonadota bacterium]